MNRLPKKLHKKITDREENNSLRSLGNTSGLIDFSSNDYLGFSDSEIIFKNASESIKEHNLEKNGSTGSRLLSGNHKLYDLAEKFIATFHNTEAVLIFNSGYDANIGLFSSAPQRGDIIFYDEFIHASIRDGISMSKAKGYRFKHNDVEDLKQLINKQNNRSLPLGEMPAGQRGQGQVIYIVTESVFSMDGDTPDLKTLADFCNKNDYHLIIDEAHAVGVLGQGKGLVQELGIEDQIFARIVTFGKALGCHGAAILGSEILKTYLINFARSFIYTTALPPHSIATIMASYEQIQENGISREETDGDSQLSRLNRNIAMLRFYKKMYTLEEHFIESDSAIHTCIVPGNTRVKEVSERLKEHGFNVKAILSPTVPEGAERLRICVHSFNKEAEIEKLVKQLATFIHNQ